MLFQCPLLKSTLRLLEVRVPSVAGIGETPIKWEVCGLDQLAQSSTIDKDFSNSQGLFLKLVFFQT